MFGEGQLIWELELEGVNHEKIGKNCVCAGRRISQGDLPALVRSGYYF
jgi:hypothetical protein